MLCHFGRTGNGYVATRFIPLSSTAESSATSGYVVVPERFEVRRELVERLKRLGESLLSFPAVDFIDAIFNHMQT